MTTTLTFEAMIFFGMLSIILYYLVLLYEAFIVPCDIEKKHYKNLAIKHRDCAIKASLKGDTSKTENCIRNMFNCFCRRGLNLKSINMSPGKVHILRKIAHSNSKKIPIEEAVNRLFRSHYNVHAS